MSSPGSQRPHLKDINLLGLCSVRGHIQVLEVITGDNEDDGGGAESNPLLGSNPAAACAGDNDGSDGALDRRQGALFETVLRPRQSRAEQLQQTAAEL